MIENFALLGLSFVPSKENFTIHKICFGGFVFIASVNMFLTYYLMKNVPPVPSSNIEDGTREIMLRKSLTYKKGILKANVLAIPGLLFFYWRHNAYCEDYVYSIFCFIEYTVVLMNVGYHFSSYYLLYNMEVVIISSKEKINKNISMITNSNRCNQTGDIDIV